jgi:hypothetical protein
MLQVSQTIEESQGFPLLVIDCNAHVGEGGVGFKSTYELIGKIFLGEEIFQAKA